MQCTGVRSRGLGGCSPPPSPSHLFRNVSIVPSKPIVLLEADIKLILGFAMKFRIAYNIFWPPVQKHLTPLQWGS